MLITKDFRCDPNVSEEIVKPGSVLCSLATWKTSVSEIMVVKIL